MTHEIHVKTVDGGVVYPEAFGFGRKDGDLWIEVGEDIEHADTVYFASGYWQQYVVDPHSEDPLDLDLDFEDEGYEDYDDEDGASVEYVEGQDDAE